MALPMHRWPSSGDHAHKRNAASTALGRMRRGSRDHKFGDSAALHGIEQHLPHKHRYTVQEGDLADKKLCGQHQSIQLQDHCVHLLQVRDCPADVAPPADAFEVWVVHRSLCRFCNCSSAGHGADVKDDAPRDWARDDSKQSSSSSSGLPPADTIVTYGNYPRSKLQRPSSAPLSRSAAQHAEQQKLLLARRDRAQRLAAGDCASELVLLARRTNISLDRVRELKGIFDKFDIRARGLLYRKEFCKLLRSIVVSKQDDEFPEHLSDERWFEPSVDGSGGGGSMDFEGFLRWYQANSFDQSLLTSGVSRTLKNLSRKLGLSMAFVESIHHVFREFDEDDDMAIQYPEFRRVVIRLLRAEEEEISETMLGRLWQAATKQGSIDEIDFETFLLWYTQHFGETLRQKTGVPLLQEYYRSIRPVAGSHARVMREA